MFSKILGKLGSGTTNNNSDNAEITQKIAKMNLTEMRAYIINKVPDFESNEEGIIEVMKRLIVEDETTQKRYIESDDMDSKIKKAFELVLIILEHKKITVVAIELVQKFIELYSDIIEKFDTDNKQIYGSRLKELLQKSIESMNMKAELSKKMSVIGI